MEQESGRNFSEYSEEKSTTEFQIQHILYQQHYISLDPFLDIPKKSFSSVVSFSSIKKRGRNSISSKQLLIFTIWHVMCLFFQDISYFLCMLTTFSSTKSKNVKRETLFHHHRSIIPIYMCMLEKRTQLSSVAGCEAERCEGKFDGDMWGLLLMTDFDRLFLWISRRRMIFF